MNSSTPDQSCPENHSHCIRSISERDRNLVDCEQSLRMLLGTYRRHYHCGLSHMLSHLWILLVMKTLNLDILETIKDSERQSKAFFSVFYALLHKTRKKIGKRSVSMLHNLSCLETRFRLLCCWWCYCTAASTLCSYSIIWKTFLLSEWRIRLCPIQLLHVGEINPQVPFYEYYDESKFYWGHWRLYSTHMVPVTCIMPKCRDINVKSS